MTIAAILATKGAHVECIDADATLREAIDLLAGKRIGAAPVMRGGAVAGILSERDLLYCLQQRGAAMLDARVEDVMTAPAVTVGPDQSILGALALMTQRRIRHLPVIDGNRMVGFVSIGDLVKQRIDRIEAEAEAMRTYIQS